MERVKFSIIIPIYNVDIYLRDCINSVLNQSYCNFEMILVDDGSTDECPSICDFYEKMDNRVKVIHKMNGGLVSARKAGIEIATGDYAICVDSDDWISDEYLMTVSEIIENNNPDIVCFPYYEVTGSKIAVKHINRRLGFYSRNQIENELFPSLINSWDGKSFPPSIWSKVYRMSIYREEQLCVDSRIKIGEDHACVYPCICKADSLYITDTPLDYYRRNDISMTKDRKSFPWNGPELIDIHHRNRITLTQFHMQEQISRRTVHALMNVVKTQFYREEDYSSISKEIQMKLLCPTYQQALNMSIFSIKTPMFLFRLFLKKRFIFPFYVLSKIH